MYKRRYVRVDFPVDSFDPVTIFPCEPRSFANLKVIRNGPLENLCGGGGGGGGGGVGGASEVQKKFAQGKI